MKTTNSTIWVRKLILTTAALLVIVCQSTAAGKSGPSRSKSSSSRQSAPQRSQSSSRSKAPARSSAPTRSAPKSRPAPTRSAPKSRPAPTRSAPPARSAPQRSSSRSAPRQATPSRSRAPQAAPSRSSSARSAPAPRQAPVRAPRSSFSSSTISSKKTSQIKSRPSTPVARQAPARPTQPASSSVKRTITKPRTVSNPKSYKAKTYTPVKKTVITQNRPTPAKASLPTGGSAKRTITKPRTVSSPQSYKAKTYTPVKKTVTKRSPSSNTRTITSIRTSEIGKKPREARTGRAVVSSKAKTLTKTVREPLRSSRDAISIGSAERVTAPSSRQRSFTQIDSRTSKRHLAPIKRKGSSLTHVSRSGANTSVKIATSSFTGRHRERTSQTATSHNTIIINNTSSTGRHRWRYEDRGYRDSHRSSRYTHVYRDSHNRLLHRIVQPKYRFGICYNWGSSYRVHYDYPYYRRRYVFVSLGGYWPSDCRYRRYYWYPSHFYNWYGYRPIAREIEADTYNYYTYNYYGNGSGETAGYIYDTGGFATHDTYAHIRENMAEAENLEPAAEELSDTYFEAGVKSFEDGDYGKAVNRFAESLRLAPEDEILPFALSQALFANGRYDQAAEIIRAITGKFEPGKEGLFYPRGLYLDEEVLLKQVDQLAGQAELSSFNPDIGLLLGYHLLGIGEIEGSITQLSKAANAPENTEAATALLRIAVQIKTTNDEEKNK